MCFVSSRKSAASGIPHTSALIHSTLDLLRHVVPLISHWGALDISMAKYSFHF